MQKNFNETLDGLLIEAPSSIAVAISGGADSFALLSLAQDWAKKNKCALHAFTVDHKLRKESTAETKKVAAWCKKNKIDHTVLNWTGAKPKTGIQDAARNARRSLLFTACAKKNIPVLLMAHHADDQAETLLMRLQRGSGLLGMTGIQPYTYDHASNVSLLRPLLNIRRKELRNYAVKKKLPFIDDPSNDDENFERVKLRKILTQLPELADGAIKTVERLTRVDWALMTTASNHFNKHAETAGKGLWLPASFFALFEDELCLRVAEQAIHTLDADSDIPLTGLEQLIERMKKDGFKGQTLAGCAIAPKVWKKRKGFLFSPAPKRRKA